MERAYRIRIERLRQQPLANGCAPTKHLALAALLLLTVAVPAASGDGAAGANRNDSLQAKAADPTIPLASQVGRVLPIFGQQWNLAVEPFYMLVHDGPAPRWGIRFGLSLLLPE